MPGVSSTMATRRPMRRLNRVDLPTLGLPTTATRGRDIPGLRSFMPRLRASELDERGLERGRTGAAFPPLKIGLQDVCLLHGLFTLLRLHWRQGFLHTPGRRESLPARSGVGSNKRSGRLYPLPPPASISFS